MSYLWFECHGFSIWLLTLIIKVVPVMFTVFRKNSCRQAKMDVTWWNSCRFFGSHIYSELDDILTVLWVLVELLWKKGRCLMSNPDLCAARGKLYPKLTFPLCHLWLTCSSHAPLNKQPFFSPPLSVTLSPCSDSHSPRRLHNTSRAQRSYWCGEERVRKSHCWRILVIVVFFRIMGEGDYVC